jgi:HTH-type transcriptional regulator / antitoxin HigA
MKVMYKILSPLQRSSLLLLHRKERDKRVADRVKAVLLYDDGWTPPKIAQALLIEENTVRDHIKVYQKEDRLKPDYKGSQPILTPEEFKVLSDHLESKVYVKVKDIQAYVKGTFHKEMGISTLHTWLTSNGFSYKKPKIVPKNADPVKQKDFINHYHKIMNEAALEDEPVLFGDSVHPSQQTRASYGWIKRGKDKPIETTGARKRLNIMGVLNLESMQFGYQDFETINAESAITFLKEVENPDIVFVPGETLLEVIEDQGMSQAQLAERMGRPKKTINEIIKGKAAITPDTAIQLERTLGVSANFWNQLEANYRAFVAKSEEEERLSSEENWLKQFPIKEMIKHAWITDVGKSKILQTKELLNFFGVASPQQWEHGWKNNLVAFRRSVKIESKLGSTSAWLRKGEIEAKMIQCAEFQEEQLNSSFKLFRTLTLEPNPNKFIPELIRNCAEIGIALVVLPGLKGAPVSGASLWLQPTKAMILLSLRYKSDDQLWFTFFHELGHILLHNKKDVFIDFVHQSSERPKEEKEADSFSAELLIPENTLNNWIKDIRIPSRENVLSFAKKIGVAPGIVVGRLQYIGKLGHDQLNGLKQRYKWTEI